MEAVVKQQADAMIGSLKATLQTSQVHLFRHPLTLLDSDHYHRPSAEEFLAPGIHLIPVRYDTIDGVTHWSSAITSFLTDYWNTNGRFARIPRYVFLKTTAGPIRNSVQRDRFPNARQNHIVIDTLGDGCIACLDDIMKLLTDPCFIQHLKDTDDYRTYGVFITDPSKLIANQDPVLFERFTQALDMISIRLRIPVYYVVLEKDLQSKAMRPLYHRRRFANTLGYPVF